MTVPAAMTWTPGPGLDHLLLLDMGRLGRVDFEQWIARWPRPDFVQVPDLD
jgi:hypothetical protein